MALDVPDLQTDHSGILNATAGVCGESEYAASTPCTPCNINHVTRAIDSSPFNES